MKMQVAASTTAQQREESFKKWLERKRMQTERRKAEEIMRQYRTNERLELENKKRQRDKEEKLAEWIKKKEEEMKCMFAT
ncbi:jg1657 [Pararge aegeria aegeria]|uniref:Jg1657 protein n=1 Tax=Pararge aegeria aegeria TaxID=348720 RepID=A0A8S4RD04_9NEOP|nr:jg1657 [Pararge aegeria aegeria]